MTRTAKRSAPASMMIKTARNVMMWRAGRREGKEEEVVLGLPRASGTHCAECGEECDDEEEGRGGEKANCKSHFPSAVARRVSLRWVPRPLGTCCARRTRHAKSVSGGPCPAHVQKALGGAAREVHNRAGCRGTGGSPIVQHARGPRVMLRSPHAWREDRMK